MLDTLKEVIANQFDAALVTFSTCIDRCPADAWKSKIVAYEFSQVALHTLIFTDFYLGDGDNEAFRLQPFHVEHEGGFGDYEEFEDRVPVTLYEQPFIQNYVAHCHAKAAKIIAAETAESMEARSPFSWLDFTRAEAHLYNIRHIQHHAAQLILRLRRDYELDIPWFRSGWPAAVS